jgi:signal peptidase I
MTKHCTLPLVILISLGLLYLRTSLIIVTVQGSSMLPTLQPGDRVLVWRHYLFRWLKAGQIVLVRRQPAPFTEAMPENVYLNLSALPPFIKRVVGLPGDKVVTYWSDLPEFEQRRQRDFFDDEGNREWCIPDDHLFIKSDNIGLDSAILGPLPLSELLGVVLVKLPTRQNEETCVAVNKYS